MTPVIFRLEQGRKVVAFLPTVECNRGMVACYAHVGQHGEAALDYYYRGTKPCPESLYADLFKELVRQGYSNLKVYKRLRHSWLTEHAWAQ